MHSAEQRSWNFTAHSIEQRSDAVWHNNRTNISQHPATKYRHEWGRDRASFELNEVCFATPSLGAERECCLLKKIGEP